MIARHVQQGAGVDYSHYEHPLPEDVYDVYMRYWGDVTLSPS
ncbi:MAG: hypothetical protein ACXV5D_05590 [Halobacteriota archaeon]